MNQDNTAQYITNDNLWDKYAVSSRELGGERTKTLKTLEGFMKWGF
jgi:hypothetical protein